MKQNIYNCVTCRVCDKPVELKCSGCHVVRYCCEEHQLSDWKIHKHDCVKLRIEHKAWKRGIRDGHASFRMERVAFVEVMREMREEIEERREELQKINEGLDKKTEELSKAFAMLKEQFARHGEERSTLCEVAVYISVAIVHTYIYELKWMPHCFARFVR